jgi:UDP-N-acetylmuramate dehydrogenase
MWPEWLTAMPGVRAHEPLRRHSQYGVGGPADLFLKVDDITVLPELVARCHQSAVPLTALGAGSNTLILDGGVRGLAVKISGRHQSLDGEVVTLDAGTMMPRAALDLARGGASGMEWGIGVPGSCGASIWGNAGAFGGEVATSLLECEVCEPDGTTRWVKASDCAFGYRDSRFRHAPGTIVLRGRFAVRRDDPASVRAATDAIQAQRKATQPYGVRSLGSTFKNPPGDFAGRLIEAVGLSGRRHGGAQISPKHANFILNVDSASAVDVLALADLAHDAVAARFGVDLEREIVVVGQPAPEPVGSGGRP